ncbi:hypothetical protein HIM_01209 [Hirsutella minnesotensis 3608]|nr:hypothetical protein HIM_01209 [Hirsutella minnesotensis 3608]
MFRAARPFARLAQRPSVFLARTPPVSRACPVVLYPNADRRPPLGLLVARFASGDSKKTDPPPPKPQIDHEKERKLGEELLEPRPDQVSSSRSVRHVMEGSSTKQDADLGAGLKHDIGIIHDTFRLSKVPRESHILGLTGTLPYLVTSLSTVFLAWDLNKELPTGNALYDAIFINHDTARYLLNVLEPLQLGYGAVIISFLGAIHWGLEYAEKQPLRERTNFRYGVGVAASVIAWPTVLMPLEYALTTQFMAFVALYFVDSRAAARGWAPPWYGMYRFLLTAMVGLAILVSLVGRAKIGTHGRLTTEGLSSTMTDPGLADHSKNWAKIEAEEMERVKKEKEEAEKKAKKKAEKEAKKAAKKDDGKSDDKKQDKQDDKEAGARKTSSEQKSGDKEDSAVKTNDGKKDGDDDKGPESKDDDKSDENKDGSDNEQDAESQDNNDKSGDDADKKDDTSDDKQEGGEGGEGKDKDKDKDADKQGDEDKKASGGAKKEDK